VRARTFIRFSSVIGVVGIAALLPAGSMHAQQLETARVGISVSPVSTPSGAPDHSLSMRRGAIGGISGAIFGGALGYFRMMLFCEMGNCDFPTRGVLTGAAIGAGFGILIEYMIRDPRWHGQISPLDSVSIRVVRDTTLLERGTGMAGFENAVVITNGTSRPLYLGACGPDAQRLVGTGWITAWTPVCGGGGAGLLRPGESTLAAVHVSGFTDGNGYPSAERVVPGTYRFVYRMGFGQVGLDPNAEYSIRTSTPFVVRQLPERRPE
jgi:hypothetical protein